MKEYADVDLFKKKIVNNDLRMLSTKTIGKALNESIVLNVEEVTYCCECEFRNECSKEIHLRDGGYTRITYCSYGRKEKQEVR